LRAARPAAVDGPLELRLWVRDPEMIEELSLLAPGREREDFARTALRIGVLALKQVRGQIDAHAVRSEVDRMLEALGRALDDHRRSLHERLADTLRDYFDPASGRFAERVDRLTRADGELASVMRSHVAGDGSALADTLRAHLGPESPLLRLVDPGRADGLLASLGEIVSGELVAQRERILKEFSLDNREGSLARLIGELREQHGRLSGDLGEQIGAMVREFSLDDEGSALSRLVQRVERAQQQITREFSLDADDSALARLRREVLVVVEAQSAKIAAMERSVAAEMAALASRRSEAERSPTRGREFEDEVAALIQTLAQRAGDLCERTGARTGLIKNCKRGDLVIELGPEHQAAAARLVVEAKEDRSYTLEKARAYLEEARKNRGALHGIFVFSAATAPAQLRPLERIGPDVFVRWDREDARTDAYLEVALSLARALCTRREDERTLDLDLDALGRAIREVEKQVDGLDEIRRASQTIESSNERIGNRVRLLARNLRAAVQALDEHAAAVRLLE
jgi:hypothetical protein